jgi:hypothetical protein
MHNAKYVPNANFWHFVALKYPAAVKIDTEFIEFGESTFFSSTQII